MFFFFFLRSVSYFKATLQLYPSIVQLMFYYISQDKVRIFMHAKKSINSQKKFHN